MRKFHFCRRAIAGSLTLALAVLLASCAAPTPTATEALPTPTDTPLPPTPIASLIPAPTHTPTATPSPTPTSTPTPVPTYTLSGTVFFDYNGNGIQDEGEPPIEGVPITVGDLSTTSGADGSYSLEGVPAGSQAVYVESPTQEPATAFRYISLSLEAFQPIEEPIRVTVNGNTTLDIALMQGFLTVPFRCQQPNYASTFYDLDPREALGRNWTGSTALGTCSENEWPRGGTCDNHEGIDYIVPEGVEVVAAAPGTVNFAAGIDTWHGTVLNVTLDHPAAGPQGRKLQTGYAHLSVILVEIGEKVSRGQVVGLSGSSGTSNPHLHFTLYDSIIRPQGDPLPLDAYRDLLDGQSLSYWTVDNDPQCLP